MIKKLKIDSVFSNKMVLQREKVITIYGQAEEDTIVNVKFCGQNKKVKAENGLWKVNLDPLKPGGPFEMVISSLNEEIILKDILVGDVFLAAGQSNMEFMLKDSLNGEKVIENTDYKFLRYYDVPRIEYEDKNIKIPSLEPGKWVSFNKENCSTFSAVAYYFAVKLYENLKIPIGIIGCNKGGTSASCWMDEEYLKKDEDIKRVYLDAFYDDIKDLTIEKQDERTRKYEKIIEDYNKKVLDYQKKYPERSRSRLKQDLGHTPWPPPNNIKSFLRPSGLYNTMFKKITDYKIKAVLWYQGEEDTKYCSLYERLLKLLIENWRRDFKDEKMPFICVQLPFYKDDKPEGSWPIVRDAQREVSRKEDNVYLTVSTDCGEKCNIHPVEKETVGLRLALCAEEKLYKEKIKGTSPFYKDYEIKENKIYIHFTSNKLFTKSNEKIKGFEISRDGENFFKIEAYIVNGEVVINLKGNEKYKELRYGWANYTEVNLYGENNLPVCPFRIKF